MVLELLHQHLLVVGKELDLVLGGHNIVGAVHKGGELGKLRGLELLLLGLCADFKVEMAVAGMFVFLGWGGGGDLRHEERRRKKKRR